MHTSGLAYYLLLKKCSWFRINHIEAFFVSFVTFSAYYASLVGSFSALYWHCASFYTLIPFYIGVLMFLLMWDGNAITRRIAISVTIVFNSGTMELLILMQGVLLFWLLVYNWKNFKLRLENIFFIFLAFVTSLMNLFAPGNFVRVQESVGSDALASSAILNDVASSFYYFIVLDVGIIGTLKNGFLISTFIFILVLLFSKEINLPKITTKFYWLSLSSIILSFFIMHFLFVAVAGYPMAGRVLNTVQFFYVLLTLVYLLFGQKLYFNWAFNSIKKYKTGILMALSIFLFGLIVSGQRKNILKSTINELQPFYNSYNSLLSDIKTKGEYNSVGFELHPEVFQLNFHPDTLNEFNTEKYRTEMKMYFETK